MNMVWRKPHPYLSTIKVSCKIMLLVKEFKEANHFSTEKSTQQYGLFY